MSTAIQKYGSLNKDLVSIVEGFHDAFWNDPFFQLNRNWRPTDLIENDKEYRIEIELPRFKREDVRVEVAKGILKVAAKNARSSYIREFSLPYASLSDTNVKLADGVLTISVPKSGDGQLKVIEVK
jgi:HSP20 family protein